MVTSVLWRIEPLLAAGSRIAWSPAEFQTIAASLHDWPLRYAASPTPGMRLRRDAGDPPARFYRIVAQVKGNRDRLTGRTGDRAADLMDHAGSRQDFHMLNRVQRFLDGPDAIPGGLQAFAIQCPAGSV